MSAEVVIESIAFGWYGSALSSPDIALIPAAMSTSYMDAMGGLLGEMIILLREGDLGPHS
jgi:hypothetical protein